MSTQVHSYGTTAYLSKLKLKTTLHPVNILSAPIFARAVPDWKVINFKWILQRVGENLTTQDNNNWTNCLLPSTPTKPSEIVAKGLELQLKAKQARQHLKWGAIHLGILAVLLFDIFNKCPYSFSQWYYVEYTAAVLVALSAFVYFLRYLFFAFSFEPIKGTLAQRDLMQFDEKGKEQ